MDDVGRRFDDDNLVESLSGVAGGVGRVVDVDGDVDGKVATSVTRHQRQVDPVRARHCLHNIQ